MEGHSDKQKLVPVMQLSRVEGGQLASVCALKFPLEGMGELLRKRDSKTLFKSVSLRPSRG